MGIIATVRLFALLTAILLPSAAEAGALDLNKATFAYRTAQYGKAAAILRPLAEDGNPFAQFGIGVMHDDGRGLPQDLSRALSWYRKAAEAGLVDAQYMLGRFYGSGRGVKQNPATAFFWFNLAAAGGDARAPILRDQHARQISTAERRRQEAKAVTWQSRHPHRFACGVQRCIYPGWTAPPRNVLYPDQLQPN